VSTPTHLNFPLDINRSKCQNLDPCRGYHARRHYLTPARHVRRRTNTIRLRSFKGGAWPRQCNEASNKLCHGMSQPQKEAKTQRRKNPGRDKRPPGRRVQRAVHGMLQGGAKSRPKDTILAVYDIFRSRVVRVVFNVIIILGVDELYKRNPSQKYIGV